MDTNPKKVLLVEDNPGDARLMQVILGMTNSRDFMLHHVEQLSSALQALAESEYALILLDLSLPDSFGLDTIQRICAAAPHLPIVVLSGLEDENLALTAVQTGAQDYLVKGQVNGQGLLRAMRYAIERKQIELALRRREAILETIGFVADKFLRTPDIEHSMAEFLSRLGQITSACRVNIFENQTGKSGETITSLRYEWVAEKKLTQLGNPALQNISMQASGFSRWLENFRRGQVIQGLVKDFPKRELKALNARSVVSTLAVPILVENTVWGFIGFDDCHDERDWPSTEVEALKVASSILGAAILRKQSEEKLEYLATYDPLTDLPNRKLFNDRLTRALTRAERNKRGVVLMLLDLDNFKEINDTWGHIKGDEVLKDVAKRLKSCVRKSDTVARLGGDEFTVVLENITVPDDIEAVTPKILEALHFSLHQGNTTITVSASIGISLYPDDGRDAEMLLKAADVAMYVAKKKHNNYQYYRES